MSASAPLIHARGLVKRFGSLTAVDGIDFDVQRGEAFGFLGPNGAGKSSTMRMIGCVSPRTARRRAAGGHARQRAHGAREPRDLRPLLRALAAGGAGEGGRAARVRAV